MKSQIEFLDVSFILHSEFLEMVNEYDMLSCLFGFVYDPKINENHLL